MPTYSFGLDSPIKFEISDKMAKNYNGAVEEFLKAQRRFTQKLGRQWDPAKEPIKIKWTKAQRKAWNDFSKVFNTVSREVGGIYENELMDDYLVKNVALQKAVEIMGNQSRLIPMAVFSGALYAFYRGLKDYV